MCRHAGELAEHVTLHDELDDLAEGIDIGTLVALLSFDQFGSDELILFDQQFAVGFVFRFRQSDIDDLGPAVVGRDDNVLGFQVAVDDSPLMHVVQGIADVDQHAFDLFLVQCSDPDMFREGLSIDKLKNDAVAQALDVLKSKRLADVSVGQFASQLIFPFQVILAGRIVGKFRFQGLQDHFLPVVGSGKQPTVSMGGSIKGLYVGIVF